MRSPDRSAPWLALLVCSGLVSWSGTAARVNAETSSMIAFDEIDRVIAGTQAPPPGSFTFDRTRIEQARAGGEVAYVAPSAFPPEEVKRPHRNIFGALGQAGTVIGNVGGVIGAGGAVSQTLGITNYALRMAPIAEVLGLASRGEVGLLFRKYIVAEHSPSSAALLEGYLNAQAAAKQAFGPSGGAQSQSVSAAAQPVPQPAPQPAAALEPSPGDPQRPFFTGTNRHYVISPEGRTRIEDPVTQTIVIEQPDEGKVYTLDPAKKRYTVASLDRTDSAALTPGEATANVTENVKRIDELTLEGGPAIGYATTTLIRFSKPTGSCKSATVSSTRVEYYNPRLRDASGRLADRGYEQIGGCRPAVEQARSGSVVPGGKLLVYQANTIEVSGGSAPNPPPQPYTVVIERGNIQQSSLDRSLFEVPADYHNV